MGAAVVTQDCFHDAIAAVRQAATYSVMRPGLPLRTRAARRRCLPRARVSGVTTNRADSTTAAGGRTTGGPMPHGALSSRGKVARLGIERRHSLRQSTNRAHDNVCRHIEEPELSTIWHRLIERRCAIDAVTPRSECPNARA